MQPYAMERIGRVVWLLMAFGFVMSSDGYMRSAQDDWVDNNNQRRSSQASDPRRLMDGLRGPPGGSLYRNGDKRDNPLLNQALDAFKQASHLERSLKRSEEAVSEQTRELKKELAKAKATAKSTGQEAYFRREEKLDKSLMRDAERETRRDKSLVAQAEKEMRGDKKFLEEAYHISDLDLASGRTSDSCPEHRCHQAKVAGLTPSECYVPFGTCPRLGCYDYSVGSVTDCSKGTICTKPSSKAWGCTEASHRQKKWLAKQCPAMHCSYAARNGLEPEFCTITSVDGTCPQLDCFHYSIVGSCTGGLKQGFMEGSVCVRPSQTDTSCVQGMNRVSSSKSLSYAPARSGVAAGDPIQSNAQKFRHVVPERRGWMMALMVMLSCGVFAAFVLFRRRLGSLSSRPRRPAPVPSYYGKL